MTANHNSNIKAAAAAAEGDEDRERERGREGKHRAPNGHGHYEPICAQLCVYATFSYGQLMSLFAEVVGLWPRTRSRSRSRSRAGLVAHVVVKSGT